MTLEHEFEQAKFNIQYKNWFNIVKRLQKWFIDYELSTTGVLINPDDALEMAQTVFSVAKNSGVLDELNCKRYANENTRTN